MKKLVVILGIFFAFESHAQLIGVTGSTGSVTNSTEKIFTPKIWFEYKKIPFDSVKAGKTFIEVKGCDTAKFYYTLQIERLTDGHQNGNASFSAYHSGPIPVINFPEKGMYTVVLMQQYKLSVAMTVSTSYVFTLE